VTIKTSSGGLAPEGSVTFYSGTASLGSAAVFGETAGGITTSGTFVTASSQASLTTTLPTGADSITAQYGGDGNYVAATSAPVNITVAPDFTPAFSGPSITVASPGASGNLTLTITGQSGYNGTINLSSSSCTGLPFGAACSFSPASITGSGQSTLTVTTTAPTTRIAPGSSVSTWIGGSGIFLAGIFVIGAMPRKRRWASAFSVAAIAWLLTVAGCSGGGPGTIPGTPTGTSNVTVNLTDGNFKHPTTFTLNVQ